MSVAQPTRAAIYVRVSTLEQGERGYSLEAQARDCRALAGELGVAVVAEFSDTDSGASWDLPGLNALLDAAKRREFHILLVYDPDRLARRMAKQLVIEEELSRSGVSIRYVTLRIGESAEDQLLKNVRSSISEYERAKIALRTARGRRAKAEKGMIVGNGWAPYGYAYTRDAEGRIIGLAPDSRTAPVVQRIWRELASTSVAKICAALNAEGVSSYHGGRWVTSTILSIVENPVYLGMAAYGRRDANKQRRAASEWLTIAVPALVDPKTYDAAKAALAHRRRRTPSRTRHDDFPLRAALACGHCGGGLSCLTSGRQRVRYYWCLRNQPRRAELDGKELCPLPGVLANAIEEGVWQRVSATLLDPEHLTQGLRSARQQHAEATRRQREVADVLEREITRHRARLQRITAERMDAEPGSESERALRAVAEDTQTTLARLRAELAEVAAQPTPGLTPDDMASLEQFAIEVRDGMEAATAANRRRVYELLRLRGRVFLDPDGIKFGRRHRYRVEWSAVVELRNGEREYKKTRLRFYTSEYEAWEHKYLPEPVVAT